MLRPAGIRSTQRMAIGGDRRGIVVFTWPAELVEQAKHVHSAGRGRRVLERQRAGRLGRRHAAHLAFWLSRPDERLYYMNPNPR